MNAKHTPTRRPWIDKFHYAFRGLWIAFTGQNSFLAHIPIALAVVAGGWYFGVSPAEWCALSICIAMVFAAELFNTGLEHLARAVSLERRDELRDALDTAAAAVLVTAIGSVAVGAVIFGPRLMELW